MGCPRYIPVLNSILAFFARNRSNAVYRLSLSITSYSYWPSNSLKTLPTDSANLRQELLACLPSFVIDSVAKESGQRVVYFGHFDDAKIPSDVKDQNEFLHGWQNWGPIVVKVISGIDPGSLTYLQREIDLLLEFDSPYFPKLRFSEVFSENPITEEKLAERLYVTVEERINALPLSQVTSRYKTEKEIATLLLKLCDALRVLWGHKKRLVHRDLKPENILIKTNGDVVVIDLGIVRESGTVGNTLTAFSWGPMSPAYSSPEQVNNDKYSISFKTDFFALGIIAYELASGANPFCPTSQCKQHEIMHNVVTLNPIPLATTFSISEEFSNIVLKLLAKEPFQRYRTVDQLVAALKPFTI